MFYAFLAILAFATALLLALPFLARAGRGAAPGNADAHAKEVYKAQLKEIDADLARGTLAPEEAEAARAEIGRRLIAASTGEETLSAEAGRPRFRVTGIAAVAAVLLVAVAAYAALGRPDLATRQLPADLAAVNSPEELVALAEAKMRENPTDARGWDVLGRAYLSLGRFDDAGIAFERALRHGGKTDSRLAALAETRIILAGGDVTDEARALLDEALALNPNDAKSLSFVGLDEEQAGDAVAARATWQKLSTLEGVDPRYTALADARLAALEAPRGPDREDVAAAETMDEAGRAAFIQSMVEGLEARLAGEGGTLTEWKQLIRSKVVLGRDAEARAVLDSALAAHSGDAAAREELAAFADELGLKDTGQRQ